MKKLIDLRAYLLHRVPELKRNPEQLHCFIDTGNIAYHGSANYSHRYKMEIRLIITEWRGHADDIVLPVLEWLTVREPCRDPNKAIQFSAQIIDSETVDLELRIPAEESVLVHFEDKQRRIEHVLPEPDIELIDNAELQFFVEGPAYNFNVP